MEVILIQCFPLLFDQAMASSEDKAYEIMRELDVNYVLVIFGGLTGYASDGRYFNQLVYVTYLKIEKWYKSCT